MEIEKTSALNKEIPKYTEDKNKLIYELRTKRAQFSNEITKQNGDSTESIDEIFGNTYDVKSFSEAKSKYQSRVDAKRIAAKISLELLEKYNGNLDINKLLKDETFISSLQDYIELTNNPKDKKKQKRLAEAKLYLKDSLDKISPDTNYNQILLTAILDSSTDWKVNKFMYNDEEKGEKTFLKKHKAYLLKTQGLLEDRDYIKTIEGINADYVKNSDNQELKNIWEATHTTPQSTELGPHNEIPLRQDKSLASAVQEINDAIMPTSGWQIKFGGDDGEATIYAGESLILNTDIYLDPNTGKFVFYISDKFGHGDKKGPYQASKIPEQVDARQMDGYITDKILKLTTDKKFTEGIKQVPDDMISTLGLKLVRKNTERQYQIKNNDKIILDNLTTCLIAPDKEGDKLYPTMYDKVKALNEYLSKESNVNPLIKKLLVKKTQFTVAEAPKISELIKGL